jgi:hypothetical protein
MKIIGLLQRLPGPPSSRSESGHARAGLSQ